LWQNLSTEKRGGFDAEPFGHASETELEGRMFRLLAGVVGGGGEGIFGLTSNLHGHLHVLTDRVGVLAR